MTANPDKAPSAAPPFAPAEGKKPQAVSLASMAASAAVVAAAAIAMAATLPGRSHGLGLITKPLLAEFKSLSLAEYGQINMAATLAGGLLCLPCGWLIDRYGVRTVLLPVMLALAAAVFAMSEATSVPTLAIAIAFTRGVGQSMLSVVSIVLMSKSFRRDSGPAMGGYAVLMTMLMAAGVVIVLERVSVAGWRPAWRDVSFALLAATPIAWLLAAARRPKASLEDAREKPSEQASNASLSQALRSNFFWTFALGISLFGLISSGVSMFQQLILEERGLGKEVLQGSLAIGMFAGLAANLIGGYAMRFVSPAIMQATGLGVFAVSLATLPLLQTAWQAYLQAGVGGAAGGLVTVLFFSIWTPAFGAQHVGRIQAAAQSLTVVASAAGPWIVGAGRDYFGSYLTILAALAGASALLAAWSLFAFVPSAARGDWIPQASAIPSHEHN